MPKDNYRAGTGLGGKGKLSKEEKIDKKRAAIWKEKSPKWYGKAEELNEGPGAEAAQAYMMKKDKKFYDKTQAKKARAAGKETKSERIAAEVEEGLREIGGKKKPNYEELKYQQKNRYLD